MRYLVIMAVFCGVADSAVSAPFLVDNPAESPRVSTVAFAEQWRIGADDEAEYLLGVISDVAADEAGGIYLLDSQQQQVFKFSATGDFLGVIARRGEGPGEIENVYQICSADQGALEMLKAFPPDLISIDAAGDPLSRVSFQANSPSGGIQFGFIYSLRRGDAGYFGAGEFRLLDTSRGQSLAFVVSFNPDGSEAHRFGEWYGGYDFTRPIKVDELREYHPQGLWDIDRAGRIYQAVDREVYGVDVRAYDGELVGSMRREWRSVKRTRAEKKAARARYGFSSNGELPPISYDMASTDAAVSRVEVVGDELWLNSPRARRQEPAKNTTVRDVFDLTGHLLETRVMVFPHDPDEDAVYHLGSRRVVVVRNFKSASRSADPNWTSQQGDERREAGDAEGNGQLEVIVYDAE